ncbi:3-oxoacyl-[acyl-carrier-protein] synthase III C-terminal domain-containing protein [Streptomyces sp. TLI_171]|uniref:3-oxoacyl-[acyl-carrier-protein] synthase III C-terminal domain-containing protein n=1 Tax=Streptomyces sp. TLI_171 TaxID=1938859 RepID=UPI000C18C850|nr:3-oxoacyl-[acyl-carrier-protein] synthase III C-terminal domain-containing protein [Streptomyces sp. TLI_171]RKE23341.1 1,3,6,8-tetrahydroxynaphthalene synthase [Streptomyces sp. TLI_171]
MTSTAAHVARPALVLGPHTVDAARISADILARNPDHPQREAIRRALGNLPGTRRYLAPYEQIVGERSTVQRKDDTFDAVRRAARDAVTAALADTGLAPGDIDCVVVSSATADKVPGLAVHLLNDLGLRPDVRIRSMTQAACAGGALALVMAENHLARYPEHTVLVLVGEFLSAMYQDSARSLEDQIYKALWGDLVAATVVAARPLGSAPTLRIDHTWEYTLPHTVERYRKLTDERGDHFSSTRDSLRSVTDLAPALLDWLGRHADGPLDFGILHPGGPAILTRLAKVLGVDEEFVRHSRDVLAQEGNLGGATVLSVLHRTYRTPPRPGHQGLVLGLGPGVSTAALLVTWSG